MPAVAAAPSTNLRPRPGSAVSATEPDRTRRPPTGSADHPGPTLGRRSHKPERGQPSERGAEPAGSGQPTEPGDQRVHLILLEPRPPEPGPRSTARPGRRGPRHRAGSPSPVDQPAASRWAPRPAGSPAHPAAGQHGHHLARRPRRRQLAGHHGAEALLGCQPLGHVFQRRRHRCTGTAGDLPGPGHVKQARVPRLSRLVPPDPRDVSAQILGVPRLPQHSTVRGRDDQSFARHLTHPKLRSQRRAGPGHLDVALHLRSPATALSGQARDRAADHHQSETEHCAPGASQGAPRPGPPVRSRPVHPQSAIEAILRRGRPTVPRPASPSGPAGWGAARPTTPPAPRRPGKS